MPETTTEEELLQKINELNEDDEIDGFIVQLPLPKHIDEQKVLLAVDARKDVDGFHPENFGRMALDMQAFIPVTPFGIMELLRRYEVDTPGEAHRCYRAKSYRRAPHEYPYEPKRKPRE